MSSADATCPIIEITAIPQPALKALRTTAKKNFKELPRNSVHTRDMYHTHKENENYYYFHNKTGGVKKIEE